MGLPFRLKPRRVKVHLSGFCVALQEEGAAAWEPAPRVTEADRRNDRQSPLRRLDRRLYLVVKGSGLSARRPPSAAVLSIACTLLEAA